MSDYIKREDAIEEFKAWYKFYDGATNTNDMARRDEISAMIGALVNMPSADVVERKRGKWIIDGHHRRCSECLEYFCIKDREDNVIPHNFCPNCGAQMTERSE